MILDQFPTCMKWTFLEMGTKRNVYLTQGENYIWFQGRKESMHTPALSKHNQRFEGETVDSLPCKGHLPIYWRVNWKGQVTGLLCAEYSLCLLHST